VNGEVGLKKEENVKKERKKGLTRSALLEMPVYPGAPELPVTRSGTHYE